MTGTSMARVTAKSPALRGSLVLVLGILESGVPVGSGGRWCPRCHCHNPVGGNPFAAGVNSDTGLIYVASPSDRTV